METKGYLQVYTGNGKGKTTAAFGLAVRALCAGKRVFIGQFVKSMKYNETRLEACFPGRLAVRQFGRGCFLDHRPEDEDVRLVQEGLRECAAILASGEWDLVILDEWAFQQFAEEIWAVCSPIKKYWKSSGCVTQGQRW